MMRKFHLQRIEDESGVSGTGRVAEGVVFSNGWVAMTWLTRHTSTAIYTPLHEVEKIHGHNGKTKVVLDDYSDYTYEPLTERILFEVGKADNGWTVREFETGSVLVSAEDATRSEHEAFINFLWSLTSKFGPSDSKYSKERIMILNIPGSDSAGEHLDSNTALEKALDHLDYASRFLENSKNDESDLLDEIEAMYEKISERLR